MGTCFRAHRWFSDNSRSIWIGDSGTTHGQASSSAGATYRGPRNVSATGAACIPWSHVFDRCTRGFDTVHLADTAETEYDYQNSHVLLKALFRSGPHASELAMSVYLQSFRPDPLTGGRAGGGELLGNQCRTSRGELEVSFNKVRRWCRLTPG